MKKLDSVSPALTAPPVPLPPANVWVVMWNTSGASKGHMRGEPGTIEDIVTDEESALQLVHYLDGMVSIHKYVLSP